MLQRSLIFSFIFGGLVASSHVQAATYQAHVEKGNTVVVVGKSKQAELKRCATRVDFDYTDPKEPAKRQRGYQLCPAVQVTPGKPTEMCRMDYPVVDIVLVTKATVTECVPN